MAWKPKKVERPKLIDTSALALPKVVAYVPKPEFYFRSEIHRNWVRSLPCAYCGGYGCEFAHLRLGTHTAASETPHDYWGWPGDRVHHRNLQHKIGEFSFWNGLLGIVDPCRHILETYALKSPCPKTITLAREEYTVRYGAAA